MLEKIGWKSRVVLCATLAVSLLAGGSARAAATRIMPLGDSITGSPGCWRALLWQKLEQNGYTNIDFVGTLPPQGCGFTYDGENEGHGGILATGMVSNNQLPAWLAATSPDIVMMHLGTNDVWSGRSTDTILAAFSTLVDQMRASNPSMKILVAQILPMNPSNCSGCSQGVVNLNGAIPAWAAGKSTSQSPIKVVDQWTGFNTATDTSDGVHPNDAGNQKISDKWYPALTAFLSGTPPVGFTLSASPAALTVAPGQSGSSTVTISRSGFTSAVAFTASNLPSGVTATFNPASTTGNSSTVTFSASASAAAGTKTVTLTGTSGTLSVSMNFNLTIAPMTPIYRLAASPASLSIKQGTSGTSTISVVASSGPVPSSVTLAASGLPSGVTVTFNPTSTTGSSTATFNVPGTAPLGTSTVTIGGTGSITVQSTTLSLTVTQQTAPSFTLTLAPTSLSVAAGTSGTATVTVTPSGGFASSVALSASGLPSGVTASFNPASTAGTSTLTLAASSGAAATTATTVTVTGTGTGLTGTATLSLTVTGGNTGTGPCQSPVTFSGNTGNFNTTGAVCYRTSATVNGWGCYNVDGRTVSVNGAATTCGQMPVSKWTDGYTYFSATAGTYPWAGIYAW